MEILVELEGYEDKKIVLMLGEEDEEGAVYRTLEKFKDEELVYKEYNDVKRYWQDTLRRVQVKTIEPEIDFMLNRMGHVSNSGMQNVCKKCILSIWWCIWI